MHPFGRAILLPTNNEAEGPSGIPLLDKVYDINFSRNYLPPPFVKDKWTELAQPRPDVCLGYITYQSAQSASSIVPTIRSAFSQEEEFRIAPFQVTRFVDFPFIASQWGGGRSTLAAQNQAARDGAAVVNSLHHFYSSPNQVPSVVDTCHSSLVCDVQYGEIWLHWKEQNIHHMEVLFWFSFVTKLVFRRPLISSQI